MMKRLKICTICKTEKQISEFYCVKIKLKDGSIKKYPASRCKKCSHIYSIPFLKTWLLKNTNYIASYHRNWMMEKRGERDKIFLNKMAEYAQKDRIKFPEKHKARGILSGAVRNGKIKKRNICEICCFSPTECHHEDYSKPLEYIELCMRCHKILHKLYAPEKS